MGKVTYYVQFVLLYSNTVLYCGREQPDSGEPNSDHDKWQEEEEGGLAS